MEDDEGLDQFDNINGHLTADLEVEDVDVLDIATEVEISTIQQNNITDFASHGCVMVMDNIDKNVRPSFQRLYNRTKSLHYCNTFAVWDRIPLKEYESIASSSSSTTLDISSLLPSVDDIAAITDEFEIFVSRYV